jgi:protein subunit release factor A
VRAAVGEDPADFASDVVKTLEAYAINRGWRWTVLDSRLVRTGKITLPGSAGVKWMLAEVEGSDVYRWMKWEHGDHRMLMETRAGENAPALTAQLMTRRQATNLRH